MNLFKAKCYRLLIRDLIAELPNKGRGQLMRMSQFLRIHPSFLSQVLRGDKDLSLEHAFDLTKFFSFTPLETKFFLKMLEWQKAGSAELKAHLENELEDIRKLSRKASQRVSNVKEIEDKDKAVFYSSWYYSALRLLSSKKNISSVEMANYLSLDPIKAQKAFSFLVDKGLVIKEKNSFKLGVKNTHLPANSPFISNHHRNWRLKSMEHYPALTEKELGFTAPMGISEKAFDELKGDILKLIEKASKKVNKVDTERVACLNIDLFYVSH